MTETSNIILACDESGAKGYADQQESYPGEVGVFAGILVPEEREYVARTAFQEIYDRYQPVSGKLHIAELEPAEQSNLRNDIYEKVRTLELPCLWYAIHVAGLNDWYLTQERFLEDTRERALEENPTPRIRQGSPRNNIPSMHEELFVGLYTNLIAFLEERRCKRVSIELRTDRIDSPIVKNFEKGCKRVLEPYPQVHLVPGWDTVENEKVEAEIRFDVNWPDSLDLDIEIASLSIIPIRDGDCFTLAADVLANNLHYLFKNRPNSELYKALNEPSAIQDHPLANNLAAFYDWGTGDVIGDRLYSHPRSR